MRVRHAAKVAFLLLPWILQGTSLGDDWPQFRGPDGNAISSEKGINKDWNKKPPKVLWKIPLTDNGFAAPSVVDGKLYIVDNKDKTDIVRALDAATGKELWRFTYPEGGLWPFGHTVATPLVYEGKVYTWSRSGMAHCFMATTGEKLWDRNLVAEYPAVKLPDMKLASSPVADGRNIIFLPGGREATAVALDKETGKTVWQSGKSKVSYASPVVATLNGRKQILIFVADGLFGIDPKDGNQLWNLPWPTQYDDKKAPTPVIVGDRIFIATTEGGETGLIDVKDDKPTVVWKHKEMQNHFATCVYYHDRIIGSSDPNFLMCLEPQTGKVIWKQAGFQCAQVLGIDDTVIALEGNSGLLVMIDPTAAEYKELGRFTPLGGQMSWVAPIVVNGCLFVRSTKELACLELKDGGVAPANQPALKTGQPTKVAPANPPTPKEQARNAGAEDKPAALAPVLKTGQTKSYTEGDDGAFQMGVAWPDPRFTVDEKAGTVTDNLTGLMWAKNLGIAGKNMSWVDALAFCKQLDLGGHKDWRLPNVQELQSLNDWGEQSSILPKDHPFTVGAVLACWASTTYASDTNIAWYMRGDAYMGHSGKADAYSVWPVRGGVAKDGKVITKGAAPLAKTGQTKSYAPGDDGDLQMGVAWPTPRFTVDGDCVTDNLTGLMWTKNANIPGKIISCYEAIDHCKNLDLGGHKDWRLPNIKELQSLTDYSFGLPGEPFTNQKAGGMSGYWSNTIYPKSNPHSAWLVTNEGYTTGNAADGSRYKHFAWPVRGGE